MEMTSISNQIDHRLQIDLQSSESSNSSSSPASPINPAARNKRKNFNPRCSTHEQIPSVTPMTIDTVVDRSINNNIVDKSQNGTTIDRSDTKQFYPIPNTNFSISTLDDQRLRLPDTHQTVIRSMMSPLSGTMDAQKMEFTYHAFNAVQELLTVYGLSISPTDIVDAFKKQAIAAATLSSASGAGPIPTDLAGSSSTTAVQFQNDLLNLVQRSADRTSKFLTTDQSIKDDPISDCDDDDDDDDDSGSMKAYDLSSVQRFNDDSSDHPPRSFDRSINFSDDDFDDRPEGREKFGDKSKAFYNPIATRLMNQLQNDEKLFQGDASKFLGKFASFLDCNNEKCASENVREHYHCYDIQCMGKILSKKEEIIRHLKWHKKRNESLTHGFLRFSSGDNCHTQFGPCPHNRKQTHYHCLQPNCDKVYISTSDVQMHSNYHRKDSAIIQEGYRATEECNVDYCMFAGQRTTHFHCRRDNCKFTFKNKADMEKHKTFHIKDEQLARDGFKKFLKSDPCPYERCRFSQICNHIHCVRKNCYYVLHSSGQLLSHKRKHERMDSEQAYRRFKMAQRGPLMSMSAGGESKSSTPVSIHRLSPIDLPGTSPISSTSSTHLIETVSDGMTNGGDTVTDLFKHLRHTSTTCPTPATISKATTTENSIEDGIPTSVITCRDVPGNGLPSDQLLTTCFTDCPSNCPDSSGPLTHAHCSGCLVAVRRTTSDLLDHLRLHDGVSDRTDISPAPNHLQITSVDSFFNRKRGRPPKNRVVEVYNNVQQSPQAIFTSFKLEKTSGDITSKRDEPVDGTKYRCGQDQPLPLPCDDLTTQQKIEDDDQLRVGGGEEVGTVGDVAGGVSVVRAAGTYFPENTDAENLSVNKLTVTATEKPDQNRRLIDTGQMCDRPFCKLKRKSHNHCDICNQAFSEEMKMKIHQMKHRQMEQQRFESNGTDVIGDQLECRPEDLSQMSGSKVEKLPEPDPVTLQNLHLAHLATFYQQNPFYYQHLYPFLAAQQGLPVDLLPVPVPVSLPVPTVNPFKRKTIDSDTESTVSKKSIGPIGKITTPVTGQNFKMFKDEPIPTGYLKFRFNEDCNFTNCGYRNHQSHFHCCRPDCYYSFCDKTRFVQHTARHERLDKLMGDDFKQYRANMRCGFDDCLYNKNLGPNNKSSHFHCLKCDFICSDTNKVVAHRRQHSKLEYIRMAGFRKVANNEKCLIVCPNDSPSEMDSELDPNECSYSMKQTHYHCLVCSASVLSRAQLSSHRHRI